MTARWQFWIDRGGTFTDVVGRRPRRQPRRVQAALGEPRSVPRCRRRRHPSRPRLERQRADHLGSGRVREDGDDGRDQRAARAQGRADGARHDAGFRDALAHRVPGAAADLRPQHRAARAAVLAGDRGARAGRRRRRRDPGARPRAPRVGVARRSPPGCAAPRSCSCTATATRNTSSQPKRWRGRPGFSRSASRTR